MAYPPMFDVVYYTQKSSNRGDEAILGSFGGYFKEVIVGNFH